MEENNFYEWLELPVEIYEGDLTKLESILEKAIKDWELSKDVRKQDRAAMYQTAIRSAIQDPVQWKHIYSEYRLRIEKSILIVASLIASKKEISTDKVRKISERYKVSYEFTESIISRENYKIIDLDNYSIHSLEIPQNAQVQIKGIQTHIEALGYNNILEFIDDQLGIITSFTDVDNSKIIEALAIIKKRCSHTSYRVRRSYIERICVGMSVFLNKNSLDDYFKFLMYDKINIVLKRTLKVIKQFEVLEINSTAYTNIVQEISKHTKDTQKAECIFRTFLEENNIKFIG